MTTPHDEARRYSVTRRTTETDITLDLCLDGSGTYSGDTGIGFFDHMLQQLAKHAGFDIRLSVKGDLHIDDHHTVEDVGIVLGTAVRQGLGDMGGIARYGAATVPMDEALVLCALDISGRGFSACDLTVRTERVGTFSTEMAPEFMRAFAHNAGITLHIRQLAGFNAHHAIEAAFKALARALGVALARSGPSGSVPSTKGVL